MVSLPDMSSFYKVKTKFDHDQEAQLAEYQKRLTEAQIMKAQTDAQRALSGGNDPAAIQVYNKLRELEKAGDVRGFNLLQSANKMIDRGVYMLPDGTFAAADGYGDALGQLGYGKKQGETLAQKQVQMAYDPPIAGAEADARHASELSYAPAIKEAQERAKRMGERHAELEERTAGLPQLMDTVGELSALGSKATYTTAGRIYDKARTELGFDPTEGAIARTEYESLVNNQILPLLRQTFGAQFTEREGESLKKTLGDPNKSPKEKDAVLRSFINQKVATIESLQRELGYAQSGQPVSLMEQDRAGFDARRDARKLQSLKKGHMEDGYVYIGGDPADPTSWKRM